MKTPMSSDTKLTKDEECESVDSTKYHGLIGTTHLGLWYPKGTGIETIVYADSDNAGDYVDRKSTSQFRLSYNDDREIFVKFMFQDQYYSFSLEEFAKILGVPRKGACVFTDKWALYELANGLPGDGPYQTFLLSMDDIITLVRVNREGPVTRVRHKKEIDVTIVSWNLFPLPKSESLEGTVAREKVVPLLLQLPPSVNHLHLIPQMMMKMLITMK
ncbi:hypothetical protein Tco_0814537, partial [Tanacetum coccineum]